MEVIVRNESSNHATTVPANGKRDLTIGRATTCDVVLESKHVSRIHAVLSRDDAGAWWVTPRGMNPTFVNGAAIPKEQSSAFKPADVIRIGEFAITIRGEEPVSNGKPKPVVRGAHAMVADAMRRKLFELEADIHYRVLDTLRLSTTMPSEEHRQRTTEILDKQLEQLHLSLDFEEYLSTEALREIILDRVHGYGKEKPQMRGHGAMADNAARFAGLVDKLIGEIGVSPDKSAVENAELVETNLEAAMRANPMLISMADRKRLAVGLVREQLLDVIFGLGPLEDLMYADDVNDIMVIPTGEIFIERGGQIRDSGRRMLSPEVSRRIVERIIAAQGRRIDQSSPMVDSRVADGSRLNAIIEPVALKGPALTIRKFAKRRLTVNDLIAKGSLTERSSEFLKSCVLARKNIILAGGTGSGKTTLLNILGGFIPDGERIVTVEDTAEIQLPQRHVVTLQAKPANLEGKGAITIRHLVRNTLRMRPDRIIVGECRGGETLDMLQAMNTGHDGSLTTIHANSPQDACRRLEVMSLEAEGIDLPSRAIREQIGSAVDVLIQVSRLHTGQRRVTSVCEVVGFDEDEGVVILEEVFALQRRRGHKGLAHARLAFTGYIPTFIDELLETEQVSIDTLF